MVEIDENIVKAKYDLEAHHERSETEIHLYPLLKLTRACHDRGKVSDSLAWDDLTGMRLEAGKVIEAREKEIQYVKDMGV